MRNKPYILLVTLTAALVLHSLSDVSLLARSGWGGLVGTTGGGEDGAALTALYAQRDRLALEIMQLQHVLGELGKVDLIGEMEQAPLQAPAATSTAASAPSYLRTQPQPQTWQAANPVPPVSLTAQWQPPPPPPPPVAVAVASPPPPPPPPPPAGGVAVMATAAAAGEVVGQQAVAALAAPVAAPAEEGPPVVFKGEAVPSGWKDFPCALRNFKTAMVTTECVIDCGNDACGAAREVCARLVECHAMVIKAPRGGAYGRAVAVLKTDAARSRDDSAAKMQLSKWWGTPALQTSQTQRPRVYVVASYGGCGSKMMAGWLSKLPARHMSYVFHFHDRHPPRTLRQLPKPPSHTIRGDYRTGRFRGGAKFKTDTPVVPAAGLDEYRVVFLYKDPVEALVSRYGFGHCKNIQGDCGEAEADWPKLDAYAKAQVDRMQLLAHFDAYMGTNLAGAGAAASSASGAPALNYPVVALNYHRLWDNLPAVMVALGLPPAMESTFPKRTETVRNDATGAAEGNKAHTEETRAGLRRLYGPLVDQVQSNPAVLVV